MFRDEVLANRGWLRFILGIGAPTPAAAAAGGGLTLITDTLLTVDTATFDFTSIPATYKHLKLIHQEQCDAAAANPKVRVTFNGDTGANYDWNLHNQAGIDQATGETSGVFVYDVSHGADATTVTSGECVIPNYAEATFVKMLRGTYYTLLFGGAYRVSDIATSWKGTPAAIDRITLSFVGAEKFKAGSRVSLYGVS